MCAQGFGKNEDWIKSEAKKKKGGEAFGDFDELNRRKSHTSCKDKDVSCRREKFEAGGKE